MPLLLLLFIGSGCAALIYEIVWFQLLQLVIGSSAISLGVLLGTFMGGMCLGSLALSYFVPARQHPLRVYAALELGIGVIGLLALVGMPLISGVYSSWAVSGGAGLLVGGIIASVCLLPPTLLIIAARPAIWGWVDLTSDGVSLVAVVIYHPSTLRPGSIDSKQMPADELVGVGHQRAVAVIADHFVGGGKSADKPPGRRRA